MVQPGEVQLHRPVRRQRLQGVQDARQPEERRVPVQVRPHRSRPLVDDLQPQVGRLPGGLHHGQGQPDEHALEHADHDDRHRGDGQYQRLAPLAAPQRHQLPYRNQLGPGMDQDGRQRRDRDVREDARQQRREQQQPDAVQDPRRLGPRARLHVRRAAYDHRGHRQRAERPAHRVADALGHQLLVVPGARAVVQPVHGRRAEQRFGGRDQRERDDRAQQSESRQLAEGVHRGRLDRAEQALHLDGGHRETERGRDDRGETDRGERAGHRTRLRRQPLPQRQDREGARAQGQRGRRPVVPEGVEQCPRQPGDLPRTGVRGLGAHHRVELPGDQHQPDPGQHALDHGDRDGPEPAAQPQRAHQYLEHSGGEHDGPEHRQPELLDGLEDQHGQTGGRTGHLEAAAAQEPGDDPADDPGDQSQFRGHARGDGHAHAQRKRHQEDHERGREVLLQIREPGRLPGARSVRAGAGTGRVPRVHAGAHRASKVSVPARCASTAPVCTS